MSALFFWGQLKTDRQVSQDRPKTRQTLSLLIIAAGPLAPTGARQSPALFFKTTNSRCEPGEGSENKSNIVIGMPLVTVAEWLSMRSGKDAPPLLHLRWNMTDATAAASDALATPLPLSCERSVSEWLHYFLFSASITFAIVGPPLSAYRKDDAAKTDKPRLSKGKKKVAHALFHRTRLDSD